MLITLFVVFRVGMMGFGRRILVLDFGCRTWVFGFWISGFFAVDFFFLLAFEC